MKKLLFVMVFAMGVLVVNAQMDTTKSMSHKSSTMSTQQAGKTPVKTADLPKAVTERISKDYTGYSIQEANSVKQNNTTAYEVVLSKGTETLTLVYDKDGKFLRKKDE